MKKVIVRIRLFPPFEVCPIGSPLSPVFTRTDDLGDQVSSTTLEKLLQGSYSVCDPRAPHLCVDVKVDGKDFDIPEHLEIHASGHLEETTSVHFEELKKSGWNFHSKNADKYKLPKEII